MPCRCCPLPLLRCTEAGRVCPFRLISIPSRSHQAMLAAALPEDLIVRVFSARPEDPWGFRNRGPVLTAKDRVSPRKK